MDNNCISFVYSWQTERATGTFRQCFSICLKVKKNETYPMNYYLPYLQINK